MENYIKESFHKKVDEFLACPKTNDDIYYYLGVFHGYLDVVVCCCGCGDLYKYILSKIEECGF